jgi:hypothetical protein
MNEMTKEETATYNNLLKRLADNIGGNCSATYNIAKLKEFVEVINLRIEGSLFKSEWE